MTELQKQVTTIRVPIEIIDRADDLMPRVWNSSIFGGRRRSRNSLLLIAMERGLQVLEAEFEPGPGKLGGIF